MRILISVGYKKLLLGDVENVGPVLSALEGAVGVDEKGGWDEPKQYVPTDDEEVKITLVPNDSLKLPENKDQSMFDKFHEIATRNDKLRDENRKLKEELQKIREAAAPKEGEGSEVAR